MSLTNSKCPYPITNHTISQLSLKQTFATSKKGGIKITNHTISQLSLKPKLLPCKARAAAS